MKVTVHKNNLTAGELHPELLGRTDLPQYAASAITLRNAIPVTMGGVKKRGGTRIMASVENAQCRVVPFVSAAGGESLVLLTPSRLRVWSVGSGWVYDTNTPYTSVVQLGVAQNRDAMFFVDGLTQPRWLRTNAGVWSLQVFSFDFLPMDEFSPTPEYGLTPSGKDIDTIITLTLDSPGVWSADDALLGKVVEINGGLCQIVSATTGDAVAQAKVIEPLRSTVKAIAKAWTLKEPVWGGSNVWPAAVTIYKQRLVFASTPTRPDVIWFSRVGNFHNFQETTNDADAFAVVSSAARGHIISALADIGDLAVLTSTGEFVVDSGDAPLSPTTVRIRQQSQYGCTFDVDPVVVGKELVFVQRSKKRLRSLRYDYQANGYVSPDLSLLASHIAESHGGIVDIAYMQEPDSLLWLALGDGKAATVTLNRDQQVMAWALHDFGGAVKGLAVLGAEDTVYLLVQRGAALNIERYTPDQFRDAAAADGSGGELYRVTVSLPAPELQNPPATLMQHRAKIDRLTVAVYQSGPVSINGRLLQWPGAVLNYTGRHELALSGWSDLHQQTVTIEQTSDQPLRLLSVVYNLSVNEK